MATTKIGICNMALGWLGAPPIAALTENRPEARYAGAYYDLAVEQCLRDHRWNFAQQRARLALIEVPAPYTMDYAYAYALPVGCLHAHTLLDAAGSEVNFIVALGADGASKIVLANEPSATLAYTARVSIPDLFDPHFTRAVARRLAADLVAPLLKNNPQKQQEQEALYERALMAAKVSDFREGDPEEEPESAWISARTGR